MTSPFEYDCAEAYGCGEEAAQELGLSLFQLPSLTYHLRESDDLSSWLSLHPDLPAGTRARALVSRAIVACFNEKGYTYVDDEDWWEDDGLMEGEDGT